MPKSSVNEFIKKWHAVELKERSAAQEHFLDLCRLLDEPSPADVDPTGDFYCFERGAAKTAGGDGWADVWKRGFFGWEYKGKRKNLEGAFGQLQQYALALENPPLMVVCDLDRFVIRTNWTNTISEKHDFTLDELRDPHTLQKLKWVMSDPDKLRPGKTRQELTEDVAGEFAFLAQLLRERKHEAATVAHFINRLVFCMFAEDVDLLPSKMFVRMLEAAKRNPAEFQNLASTLFGAMRTGGLVGFEKIEWFNGGLFDNDDAISLTADEIGLCLRAAVRDWSEIDPSIFGTLFVRGLDPDKRSETGAEYTDREKIMMIVEPVITQPLLREWETIRALIGATLETANKIVQEALASAASYPELADEVNTVVGRLAGKPQLELFTTLKKQRRVRAIDTVRASLRVADKALTDAWIQGLNEFNAFLARLRGFRVLDPACGSGNFLYLALIELKNIERRVTIEGELLGFPPGFPAIGPEALLGIEINPYAAELARVSVWIGEIQWMRRNGFDIARTPVLRSLNTIECRDALVGSDNSQTVWPEADVIIGNPPFLGNKKMIRRLSEPYVTTLRKLYSRQLPHAGDLVCFWFAKAWGMIEAGATSRVGLVSTNSIRSGSSNDILRTIAATGHIFEAWQDEPWIVDGAHVRVSLVCFNREDGVQSRLDGQLVPVIQPNLVSQNFDITQRHKLAENNGTSFVGVILNGDFEISGEVARSLLAYPSNVNARPNSDVIRPTLNGDDFNGNRPDKWVIDFGTSLSEAAAAHYEEPFKLVEDRVKPYRQRRSEDGKFVVRAKSEREIWWRYARSRKKMRAALAGLDRYIATPMVSSFRTFDFLPVSVLPDQKLVVFARRDEAFLGILQSRVHRLWTVATCSWIGVGNDVTYSNTAVFDTFPFPAGLTPAQSAEVWEASAAGRAIAKAMVELRHLRNNWLSPPELIVCRKEDVPGYPDRVLPANQKAAALLANRNFGVLYSKPPTWLINATANLDQAVVAAYGWSAGISDNEVVQKLLDLNRARET